MDDETYNRMQTLRVWESKEGDAVIQVRTNGHLFRTEIAQAHGCYPLLIDEPQIKDMAVQILQAIAVDLYTGRLILREEA
jgi:hypothetical protein